MTQMVAFVIQSLAANGRGCLGLFFQSWFSASASVVDEDCRDLCWLRQRGQSYRTGGSRGLGKVTTELFATAEQWYESRELWK